MLRIRHQKTCRGGQGGQTGESLTGSGRHSGARKDHQQRMLHLRAKICRRTHQNLQASSGPEQAGNAVAGWRADHCGFGIAVTGTAGVWTIVAAGSQQERQQGNHSPGASGLPPGHAVLRNITRPAPRHERLWSALREPCIEGDTPTPRRSRISAVEGREISGSSTLWPPDP